MHQRNLLQHKLLQAPRQLRALSACPSTALPLAVLHSYNQTCSGWFNLNMFLSGLSQRLCYCSEVQSSAGTPKFLPPHKRPGKNIAFQNTSRFHISAGCIKNAKRARICQLFATFAHATATEPLWRRSLVPAPGFFFGRRFQALGGRSSTSSAAEACEKIQEGHVLGRHLQRATFGHTKTPKRGADLDLDVKASSRHQKVSFWQLSLWRKARAKGSLKDTSNIT